MIDCNAHQVLNKFTTMCNELYLRYGCFISLNEKEKKKKTFGRAWKRINVSKDDEKMNFYSILHQFMSRGNINHCDIMLPCAFRVFHIFSILGTIFLRTLISEEYMSSKLGFCSSS